MSNQCSVYSKLIIKLNKKKYSNHISPLLCSSSFDGSLSHIPPCSGRNPESLPFDGPADCQPPLRPPFPELALALDALGPSLFSAGPSILHLGAFLLLTPDGLRSALAFDSDQRLLTEAFPDHHEPSSQHRLALLYFPSWSSARQLN